MHKIDIHCHALAFPEYTPTRKDGHKYLSVDELLTVHDNSNTEFGVLLPVIVPEAHWATMSNEEI